MRAAATKSAPTPRARGVTNADRVTLDCGSPQLVSYPGRYFSYFNQVDVPILEGLVIPFRAGEQTQGTVWIVSHDQKRKFNFQDVRIMEVLTEWVCCTRHVTENVAPRFA